MIVDKFWVGLLEIIDAFLLNLLRSEKLFPDTNAELVRNSLADQIVQISVLLTLPVRLPLKSVLKKMQFSML